MGAGLWGTMFIGRGSLLGVFRYIKFVWISAREDESMEDLVGALTRSSRSISTRRNATSAKECMNCNMILPNALALAQHKRKYVEICFIRPCVSNRCNNFDIVWRCLFVCSSCSPGQKDRYTDLNFGMTVKWKYIQPKFLDKGHRSKVHAIRWKGKRFSGNYAASFIDGLASTAVKKATRE